MSLKSDEGPLTVKEYLETADDASRRTRFITVAITVASVLLLVSVLNSCDSGWISLRIHALERKQIYAIRKFPLLCACSDANPVDCEKLKPDEIKDVKAAMREIKKLQAAKADRFQQEEDEKSLEEICKEETGRLNRLTEALLRSSAETKYTVRVPFFGAAFDVNDVGILAGAALIVLLLLLRLSLRSSILSLRVGFKKAFDSNEEADFYDVLATRQVFTFPKLEDERQKVDRMRGRIEQFWRRLRSLPPQDGWSANRTKMLRFVPQALSLAPAFVYGLQFLNDVTSVHYGLELHWRRTVLLLIVEGFLLLVLFVFGLWCITKWNEIDKIWDYFHELVSKGKKLGLEPNSKQ